MEHNRIFITGVGGQLGKALLAQFDGALGKTSQELDITDFQSLDRINWKDYDTIINAAAYTKVDQAETQEGRIRAWKVNVMGVFNLGKIAMKHNLTFVHYSSDYVFDGRLQNHTETEDFSPLGVYGQTKAAGDFIASLLPKHYVIRTSWVIGDGNNFVRTMLGLAQRGINPSVVNDQIGRLSFTKDLALATDYLLSSSADVGVYNVSNDGEPSSWADITRTIFELANLKNLYVSEVSTEDYFKDKQGSSPRPLNSTLDLSKLKNTGFNPKDWKQVLKDYIKQEGDNMKNNSGLVN